MAMINTEADFLRALSDHPEWKASMRAQILGEELLQLPVQFQAFVQRQQQFNDRMHMNLPAPAAVANVRNDRELQDLIDAGNIHWHQLAERDLQAA